MEEGYHKRKISKGIYGEISKVQEEIDEFCDAKDQNIKIMEMLELSDIYGALESVAESYGLNMEDLQKMSNSTKNAFRTGKR
jgi:hypothetical protein